MTRPLYQHPHFKHKLEDWIVYRDLYEGKHSVLTRGEYLWPHLQETVKDAQGNASIIRSIRQQRTRYLNIPEIIVSLLLSYLFRVPPELDEKAKALLGEREKDIDGQGTSFANFIQNGIAQNYLVYGKPIVLVDAFPVEGGSKGEEQALGLRPFMELISPLQAVDWDIESQDPRRLGKLNMFRHEYDLMEPRQLSSLPKLHRYSDELYLDNGKFKLNRYRVEIDESQQIIKRPDSASKNELAWEQVKFDLPARASQMAELPVAFIDSVSWIKDVCEETLRHFNLRSTKDNIELHQAFQRVFIAADGLSREMIQALAENIITFIPQGGTVHTVDPVPTGDLANSIAQSLENAFKLGLNQLRSLPSDSRAAQSGDTISEEKDNPIALAQAALGEIEDIANQALGFYASFLGNDNFDGKVTLNKELTEENYDSFITVYQAFRDTLSKVDGLDAAIAEKVICKLGLPEETEEELVKKVKSTTFGPSKPEIKKTALDGVFGARAQ